VYKATLAPKSVLKKERGSLVLKEDADKDPVKLQPSSDLVGAINYLCIPFSLALR